jgi:hypothetical protein
MDPVATIESWNLGGHFDIECNKFSSNWCRYYVCRTLSWVDKEKMSAIVVNEMCRDFLLRDACRRGQSTVTRVEKMQATPNQLIFRHPVSGPINVVPDRQSQCSLDSVELRSAHVHHAMTVPWMQAYLMARFAMAVNTARYSDGWMLQLLTAAPLELSRIPRQAKMLATARNILKIPESGQALRRVFFHGLGY